MTITQEQKADIGNRYLAEVSRRIAVRTKAKNGIAEPENHRTSGQLALAAAIADLKKLGFVLPGRTIKNVDVNNYGAPTFDFEFEEGGELSGILQSKCPKTLQVLGTDEDNNRSKELKRKLCAELELLHELKAGHNVGAFQQYVGRLWVPKTKESLVNSGDFMAHFESFADSKRGFVCQL